MPRRVALGTLLALLASTGCAGADRFGPRATLYTGGDPAGDVRLTHPPRAGIVAGTFDLRGLELSANDDYLVVTVTFGAKVEALRGVRLSEDRVADVFPQTVDVYLDGAAEAGRTRALPGRDFYVPAAEGWDAVLVMTSVPQMREDGVLYPLHLIARGRQLIGVFRRSEAPAKIQGALAVVLAASSAGEGRVRPTSGWLGDCQAWDQARCTLKGPSPPVLDSLGELRAGQPVRLTYFSGPRPSAPQIPVVFARPGLLVAEPVDPDAIKVGLLATLLDKEGAPAGTAVVVSVVDKAASLKVLAGDKGEGVSSVVFGSERIEE